VSSGKEEDNFLSSQSFQKTMQRDFEMSTNMHILGGFRGGVQQRWLRVKI
jgi:hypothetical protein